MATPTFSPDCGDYAIPQPRTVTISTTTATANMRYTLNGTTPSQTNGELIASNHGTVTVPLTSGDGTTLRAIAFAPGMSDSEVHEADFYYTGDPGPNLGDLGDNASNQSAIAPGYDVNGNLIAYKGWSFSYDAQNRLTSASNGAHTALFHYDGKNRQIMRSIDGVVRFSVWDDWELLEEYDTSNARTAAYLQGAHGVIKSLTTNIYYYQDNLGSTTHIANASGALLESYRYDLYGTPSYFNSTSQPINSSTYNINDLYAGERWIPELRVYDLRNRFMSPELGRFLQTDPIGFKGDASNLYRYCHNDPVDFTDPTGLVASDTSRFLPDRLWAMACFFDSGNSFQGSLSEFMQRLSPAGMDGGGGGGGNSGGNPRDSGSANVQFEFVRHPTTVEHVPEIILEDGERASGKTEPQFSTQVVPGTSTVRADLYINVKYADGPGSKAGPNTMTHTRKTEPEHEPFFNRFAANAQKTVEAMNQRLRFTSPEAGRKFLEGSLREKYNEAYRDSKALDNKFSARNMRHDSSSHNSPYPYEQ